jgi:hypothetical protein
LNEEARVHDAARPRGGVAACHGGYSQRLLTEVEKAEIIECEWAKARAKNPKVVMRVDVRDETDESGKPRVSVVIAFRTRG